MLSLFELQRAWRQAIRQYAENPLMGDNGETYIPIRGKAMAFLDSLWRDWEGNDTLDLGALLGTGKDIRVFGDPHFEHANIIHLCARPFAEVHSMDAQLWSALEQAHTEADMVLCVGDWALKNPIFWQRKAFNGYPGKTASVVGNHDMKNSTALQWFEAGARASLAFTVEREWVQAWVSASEPNTVDAVDWKQVPRHIHVGVSHWPIAPRYYPGNNWVNLHGHTHNKPSKALRMNASVEEIGFAPKSIPSMFTAQLMDELVQRQQGIPSNDTRWL